MGDLGKKMGEHGRAQAGGDTREAARLQALGEQQRELGRKLSEASRRQALAQTQAERRAAGREVEKLQQQMEDAQDEMEEVNDRIAAVQEREADKTEAISRQMDQRVMHLVLPAFPLRIAAESIYLRLLRIAA